MHNIYTMRSLPVEIKVDGGWAILQVPPHPGFVGDALKVTCRVRGNPPLREMILYKDAVEVMRQNGSRPYFYLTNLTLEDQGMYSCRASWDVRRRTHSVISAGTHVKIIELLSQPRLEIDAGNDLIGLNMMKLTCQVQYNARAPAPPINYYFYKNNDRLGPATSENHDLVKRTPGEYSCKAKVPELGISRQSEPMRFGQIPEPQATTLPHPRYQWPSAHPTSFPDRSKPPAAQPAADQQTPDHTHAPPLKETVPTNHVTMPGHVNRTREPADLSAETIDFPKF